ncbi:hypothetical protein [Staphylococcus pettenkoferi]|uniref:hypothetical protein n=1 Tax=Staphylococcus pettenkoferi TaxID=170573 RepID=UPI0025527742|nr:hypothetical protein [Staphylococcus pettenkoferi]MDK7284325.1 hypothetical protein [Staphylococcus pettenkoferi]
MINEEEITQEIEDNFTKENYITCIDLMLGLTQKEVERLENKSIEEVRKAYNLALLENTDELFT